MEIKYEGANKTPHSESSLLTIRACEMGSMLKARVLLLNNNISFFLQRIHLFRERDSRTAEICNISPLCPDRTSAFGSFLLTLENKTSLCGLELTQKEAGTVSVD